MGYIRVLKKLENEGDDHNRNFGKKGAFDNDRTQEDVTYFFTKHSPVETWLDKRRPKESTFKFTARDFVILPHAKDAKPFYMPTEQIDVNESIVTTVALFYRDLRKNFFTTKDNEVFKKLATIPLFEYFKHQNTLKFILTDISIYDNIHDLHLRKAWKYIQLGGEIKAFLDYNNYSNANTLLSKMNKKKSLKIKEVTDVLITVPHFRYFLIYNGERALKKIKQEVQAYKEYFIKKLPNKPYFQKLIDALDIDKFESAYQKIYAKVLESTPQENYVDLHKLNATLQMIDSQKMNMSQKVDQDKQQITESHKNGSCHKY